MNDYIYIYDGTIWTPQTSLDQKRWRSVALNASGSLLIAVFDYIYIYNRNTQTLTPQTSPGIKTWSSVASNELGTVLIAAAKSANNTNGNLNPFDTNYIYIYDGTTWTEQTLNPGLKRWTSVASNALGTVLVAAADYDYIYIYDGTTWNQQSSAGQKKWTSVASNASGSVLVAAANSYIYVYNSTTQIWSEQTSLGEKGWSSVASNNLGTVLIAADSDSYIYIYRTPTGNICFPKGTPILTDQGLIAIDMINIEVNTIHNKKIVDITKTVSKETFLVSFEKDALGIDMPSQETIISPGHTLLYEGEMHAAKWFLEKFPGVKSIPYTGEPLYNVLLEKHDTMNVNNLICETLLPDNPIAKFYTKQCKLSQENRDIMVNILKGCLERDDIATYNQILQCC